MKPILSNLFMPPKKPLQIFFWPIVIGLITAFSLMGALIEDGLIEDVSNIALAVIVAVMGYFYFFKSY